MFSKSAFSRSVFSRSAFSRSGFSRSVFSRSGVWGLGFRGLCFRDTPSEFSQFTYLVIERNLSVQKVGNNIFYTLDFLKKKGFFDL